MVGMERYDFFGPIEAYMFFAAARNTRIRNSDKVGSLGENKHYG